MAKITGPSHEENQVWKIVTMACQLDFFIVNSNVTFQMFPNINLIIVNLM